MAIAIPNWLRKLFISLKLISSEQDKLKKDIAKCEAEIRQCNLELDNHVKVIQNHKADYELIKKDYDSARGTEKDAIAIKLKAIIQELENLELERKRLETKYKNQVNIKTALYEKLKTAEDENALENAIEAIQQVNDIERSNSKAGQHLSAEIKKEIAKDQNTPTDTTQKLDFQIFQLQENENDTKQDRNLPPTVENM